MIHPLILSSRALSRPFSYLLMECSALRFVIRAWRFSGAWKTSKLPRQGGAAPESRFSIPGRTGVRVMTEVFPLERTAAAYDLMMSGKARFRVVLTTTGRLIAMETSSMSC